MSDAILRAQTEDGEVWDDPSEDLLFELMTDLDADDRELRVATDVPFRAAHAAVTRWSFRLSDDPA